MRIASTKVTMPEGMTEGDDCFIVNLLEYNNQTAVHALVNGSFHLGIITGTTEVGSDDRPTVMVSGVTMFHCTSPP
jgi:hypothetical protein